MTLLIALLLALVMLTLAGLAGPWLFREARVMATPSPGPAPGGTLFVLVHGFDPVLPRWHEMERALAPHGHVLRIGYNAAAQSNADALEVARGIAAQIAQAHQALATERVVLVAHSMGALLARRALLEARGQPWAAQVQRVVLLAGVNRGWDIGGEAPADSDALHRFGMKAAYWGGRMLGIGKLVSEFQRGEPFVANLRIDWMRWMRSTDAPPIEVVQLLGDIDDIVTRADNEDLRVIASGRFAMLAVRGSGHGDVIDFGTHAQPGDAEARRLGEYRRGKFLLATIGPFAEVLRFNEQLPPATDPAIEEAVFVLHGIRDLGRWSADFEAAIQARFADRRGRLAIVSPRYGYFGMGPFLFEDVRDRYVRWFMDEYTEALARWPNLRPEGIRFFGHSNGTYVVARALEKYEAMRIERVVFAGSVVPRRYDWAALGERVGRVRNYVGTDDWVVALFPRLFELWPMRWLGNDIGSAGFNGFDDERRVDNVRFVDGQHSAFASRVDEIVDFLLSPGEPKAAEREARGAAGEVMSFGLAVWTVWAALALAVVGLGVRIVGASPVPGWPVLVAYGLLLLAILRTV